MNSSILKLAIMPGLLLWAMAGCSNGSLSIGKTSPTGFQQAYQFNGTPSSVLISGVSHTFPGTMTIEFFFKTSSGAQQYFFSDPSNYFNIYMNSSGQIIFTSPISGGCSTPTPSGVTGPYNDGHNHYLVAGHTTTGSTLYIDGTSVGTIAHGAIGSCTLTSFYLGRDNSALYYFNGILDEFRISTVVKYPSSPPTPSTPFTSDISTATLLHFDTSTSNDFISGGGIYSPLGIMQVTSPFP